MKIAWRVCDMKPNTLNLCLGKLRKPLLNNQIFLTKILYGKNGRQKLMRLFFTQMHAENITQTAVIKNCIPTPKHFMLVNIYFQKRSLNYFENYIKYLINGRLKRPFYSNKIWRPGISQRGRRPKGRKRERRAHEAREQTREDLPPIPRSFWLSSLLFYGLPRRLSRNTLRSRISSQPNSYSSQTSRKFQQWRINIHI